MQQRKSIACVGVSERLITLGMQKRYLPIFPPSQRWLILIMRHVVKFISTSPCSNMTMLILINICKHMNSGNTFVHLCFNMCDSHYKYP